MNHLSSVMMISAASLLGACPLMADERGENIPAYLEDIGAKIEWNEYISLQLTDIWRDIEITRYNRILRAQDMRIGDDGHIILNDIHIENIDGFGGDGTISISRLEMSDKIAFYDLFDSVNATPFQTIENRELIEIPQEHYQSQTCHDFIENGPFSYYWNIDSIHFIGDVDALPEGIQAEEMKISHLRQDISFEQKDHSCVEIFQVTFDDLEIMAIDESRGIVEKGIIAQDTLYEPDFTLLNMKDKIILENLSLIDSQDIESARIDQITWNTHGDLFPSFLSCGFFTSDGPTKTSSEILQMARETDSAWHLDISGIHIEQADFMPVEFARQIGIEHIETISGSMIFNAYIKDASAQIESKINIDGLARGEIKGKIDLPNPDHISLPGFLHQQIPLPGELLDVKLHHFAFHFDDENLNQIIESMTGRDFNEHLTSWIDLALLRASEKIPPYIADQVKIFGQSFGDILQNGGGIEINPEIPRPLMMIAMQALMEDSQTDSQNSEIRIFNTQ